MFFRIHEVVEGKAPSTTSICRYNQRVVPVLSFVSQFACPAPEPNLEDLDQWAVLEILRMPPNSMSRNLCHSISFCFAVDPILLRAYCAAGLYRFAISGLAHLQKLAGEVASFVGDDATLDDAYNVCKYGVPFGGLVDPPILVTLLNSMYLQGQSQWSEKSFDSDPTCNWIAFQDTPPCS